MDFLTEQRILAGIISGRPGHAQTEAKAAEEPAVPDPHTGLIPDKFSKNGWARLAAITSSSNPDKQYIIGLRQLKSGAEEIGCSCPGWIYHHKPCKHLKAFLGGQTGGFLFTPFGKAWSATKHARSSNYESLPEPPAEKLTVEDFHWHLLTPEMLAEWKKGA